MLPSAPSPTSNTPSAAQAVVMHTDQATGRFRGTCFVTFASRDELAEALKLDGEVCACLAPPPSIGEVAGHN